MARTALVRFTCDECHKISTVEGEVKALTVALDGTGKKGRAEVCSADCVRKVLAAQVAGIVALLAHPPGKAGEPFEYKLTVSGIKEGEAES